MTEEQNKRIEELTTILLSDLKRYSAAMDNDLRFEIVKAIRERINKLETELEELVQLQKTEQHEGRQLHQ